MDKLRSKREILKVTSSDCYGLERLPLGDDDDVDHGHGDFRYVGDRDRDHDGDGGLLPPAVIHSQHDLKFVKLPETIKIKSF